MWEITDLGGCAGWVPLFSYFQAQLLGSVLSGVINSGPTLEKASAALVEVLRHQAVVFALIQQEFRMDALFQSPFLHDCVM